MPADGANGLVILVVTLTTWSNPLIFNVGQTTFNSNVHLIFNISQLVYNRDATATVISWTGICGHQNMQTQSEDLNFYFETAMNNLHI